MSGSARLDLVDGQFGRGIGFETFVADGRATAHRQTVATVGETSFGTFYRLETSSQARREP